MGDCAPMREREVQIGKLFIGKCQADFSLVDRIDCGNWITHGNELPHVHALGPDPARVRCNDIRPFEVAFCPFDVGFCRGDRCPRVFELGFSEGQRARVPASEIFPLSLCYLCFSFFLRKSKAGLC